jgi:methylenetetrahydrofolate dehydrogenase (NADP+)/methenyltetrahydrofolate cyclohydrolase
MTAQLIDGKARAAALRAEIAEKTRGAARAPGLAVVLIGDDPASAVYVRSKERATEQAGMRSFAHRLPTATTQADLLALIAALNINDAVDGILVQLPLPAHIDESAVLRAVDPSKDVDGFHPISAGLLATGQAGFVPCTPLGCLMLLKETRGDLSGLDALVIGRSNIVGKPMAQLLLREHCTVTIAHSRTPDLPDRARRADIIVAAVGRSNFVRGNWVKPGATIIDVGINRVIGADGASKLVGDVAFDEALPHAVAITPVPGGVGPMTIAVLLHNTLLAYQRRNGS